MSFKPTCKFDRLVAIEEASVQMPDVRSLVFVDDSGQGLVEYALIIALIALVCIISLITFARGTNHSLSNSANQIPG